MSDQREAWERWYEKDPPSWKGSPLPLPELPSGARVIDVGCGNGNTMLQALEKGYNVTGLDFSKAATEMAGERIASRGFDAELVTGNILDPGLDLGRFDCVLLHHVLDNMLVEERKITLQRVKDLLEEGGIISFQDLSTGDVRYGKGEEVERNTYLKGDGIRLHFFELDETRDLFSEFKVLELEIHQWVQGKGDRRLKRSRIKGIFQLLSF